MNNSLIMELILKYARGASLSEEESRTLEEWRAASANNRALLESFANEQWLEERLQEMDAIPSSRMWTHISARIGAGGQEAVVVKPIRWRWLTRGVGIAAAVLLVFTGGNVILDYLAHKEPLLKPPVPVALATGVPGYWRTKVPRAGGGWDILDSTGHAKPVNVTLPDGSQITLSYGSRLEYPERFDGTSREVSLSGQAAFDVAKNEHQPFIVHAGGTAVRVLGTYFDVKAYSEDSSQVTLIRGAVQVTNGQGKKDLKPSEEAVAKNGRVQVFRVAYPEASVSWADQRPNFNFHDSDPVSLLQELARWYQVKVVNPDRLNGVVLTGIFLQDKPLDSYVQQINVVEHDYFRIEHRGDALILHRPHD